MDLIRARISDLTEEEREILEIGACLGFEFEPRLIAEVVDSPPIPVLRRLGNLEKSTRLVRSAGDRFTFDHHQVQEALYLGMPEALRLEYHSTLGRVLESRSGDPVAIAEHYLRAGRGVRALSFLDAALTGLEEGCLFGEVVRLADRALAEPGLIEGAERAELLLRKEGRLSLLFTRREEQSAALTEAGEIADSLGDPPLLARVGLARARFAVREKEFETAAALLEGARDRACEAADADLAATITRELGYVFFRAGDFARAEETLASALKAVRRSGKPGAEALVLQYLGHVEHARGREKAAHDRYAAALEKAREAGDRMAEGKIAAGLGNVFYRQGRNAEARERFQVLLEVARETGVRIWEASATGSIANTFPRREARPYIERALALARELGARDTEATASVNLGINSEELGLYADALESYEHGLSLRRAAKNAVGEHGAAVWIGTLRARLGDLEGAREMLTAALAGLEEIGAKRQIGEALLGLGEVAEYSGETGRARELYERARGIHEESARSSLPGSLAALARLDVLSGDRDAAERLIAEILEVSREMEAADTLVIASALAAVLDPEKGAEAEALLRQHEEELGHGTRLEARAHLWRATNDRAHLEEAGRLLEALVEGAPEEYRTSLVESVPLHRELRQAAAGP